MNFKNKTKQIPTVVMGLKQADVLIRFYFKRIGKEWI